MWLYKGWREKVKNSNFKLKTFAISYFNLYQKWLNASSIIFYLEQRGIWTNCLFIHWTIIESAVYQCLEFEMCLG